MRELETIDEFEAYFKTGRSWNNIAIQGLDLTAYTEQLMNCDFNGSIFLGCSLSDEVILKIINTNGLQFPKIKGLPYKTFSNYLYRLETLFDNFDPKKPESYKNTTDWIIYQHFLKTGKGKPDSVLESLARRLHDHSITDALNNFIEDFGNPNKIVGIMGGHSTNRDSQDYLKSTLIARNLARSGYLMVSGGGPGAMEATHLGVWFAAYDDSELNDAIKILSSAPVYNNKYWLSKAFDVIKKYPPKKYNGKLLESLGIPTWFYGHEPPTPFASKIAKYFANSIREAGLLAIALGGIIFTPGMAGTVQEIFQDACQNRYKTFAIASPMIFLNSNFWINEKPVYPLLKELAKGHEYKKYISISDDVNSIVDKIINFNSKK
jgi:predicted Rossmann-fold nucleotide-binding protein